MSQPPYDPNNPYGQQQNPYGQQPQGWQGAPSTDPFGKPAVYFGAGYTPPPPPPRNRPACLILFIVAMACGLPLCIIGLTVLITGGALAGMGGMLNDMGLGDLGSFISTAVDAMQGPETVAIQGDVTRFDPQAGLDQAAAFAGAGAQFAGLDAQYVRSDGTMDLTATSYNPRVTYSFLRPIEPPANAPPVGAAGNTGGQWYEPITIEAYRPGQVSTITTTGGGISTRIQFVNQGMRKDVGDPTTNPFSLTAPPMRCSFADLWREAIERGASADAVATIRYSEFGDEWTYDFIVPGIIITFNEDCSVDE